MTRGLQNLRPIDQCAFRSSLHIYSSSSQRAKHPDPIMVSIALSCSPKHFVLSAIEPDRLVSFPALLRFSFLCAAISSPDQAAYFEKPTHPALHSYRPFIRDNHTDHLLERNRSLTTYSSQGFRVQSSCFYYWGEKRLWNRERPAAFCFKRSSALSSSLERSSPDA